MRSATLIFSFFISSIASAQWQQRGTDRLGEAAGDLFGVNVDISANGERMVVGATANDGGGADAGSVRVFEWDNNDWLQIGADLDGEGAGDNFGISVSMNHDGSVIAAGGYANDGIGADAGHVRVFEWNGSAWTQKGVDIEGQFAGDFSGLSIALDASGNTLIIGDYYNDNTDFVAGSARIYEWNGSSWMMKGSPLDGEAFGDNFGFAVDMSEGGDTVAIGGIGNDEVASNAGHTRVFAWSGTAWNQVGADIDGVGTGYEAGHSVSLNSSGSIVAIGAPGSDVGSSNSGNVKVYEWSGSAWTQKGSTLTGETTNADFGHDVMLSSDGNTLIIGANLNDDPSPDIGHLQIYEWGGTDWVQKGQDINGDAEYDWMGKAVAVNADGSTIVGSAIQSDLGGNNAGLVRAYQFCAGLDTAVTQTGMTLTVDNTFQSYQWLDCDNGYAPLTAETNSSFTATQNGTYAVEISDGICKDTSSCFQIAGLGIEHTTNDLRIWVAEDEIIIQGVTQNTPFFLYALDGRLVRTGWTKGKIDISTINKGLYILSLNDRSQKIIIP